MTGNNFSHNISSTLKIEPPGFLYVDHIAISVCKGELENHVKMYEKIGFKVIHREEIEGTDQVREVLLKIGESPNLIQLLEPLSKSSPVQKQIDRNSGKGGLAHVGLRVKNAQEAFDFLKAEGYHIIDKAPRKGSRGTSVFFLHPKSHDETPFGVLYEIVEDSIDC
tara:strand:- start:2385 stop:2882 length:498 start_codon:yes stop_codon:yes gene_type:complete